MEPSIFACFQNAGDCPIERVTVICRYGATTNSEEYVNDGTHASPTQRKRLQWFFSTIQSSPDSSPRPAIRAGGRGAMAKRGECGIGEREHARVYPNARSDAAAASKTNARVGL